MLEEALFTLGWEATADAEGIIIFLAHRPTVEALSLRGLGVEVILFRGNDRNRRRGFHNTYVFYQRFRALLDATLH